MSTAIERLTLEAHSGGRHDGFDPSHTPPSSGKKVRVEDMRDYLHRLRVRMAKRGFPTDDPLYVLVVEAQKSIGELYMNVRNRAYRGPTSMPPPSTTAWLDQR